MLNLGMEVGDEYEEARQKQSALGVHNDCRGPIAPMPIIPNSYIEHRNNPRPTRSSYNPSQTIHDPIPDDGLRAWLVVFGGVINFIVAFGKLTPDFIAPSMIKLLQAPPPLLHLIFIMG